MIADQEITGRSLREHFQFFFFLFSIFAIFAEYDTAREGAFFFLPLSYPPFIYLFFFLDWAMIENELHLNPIVNEFKPTSE